MATLSEHADNIKAALMAAEADGFKIETDITYAAFESSRVETVELDIWDGPYYINVFTEDWS